MFGGFQATTTRSLWNYEAGVKAQGRGFTFNAAAFHNDIKNLQVTLDAGSCSSRIVVQRAEGAFGGLRIRAGLQPADGLELSLAGSVIEARVRYHRCPAR